jgi:thioredoxin 1
MDLPAGVEVFRQDGWDMAVVSSPLPVVVGFWAEWCIPCRLAAPALAEAARHFRKRLRFGLVNVDEEPGLAERYEVSGLPTVLVLQGGRPVVRRVGLMGRERLRAFLEGALRS